MKPQTPRDAPFVFIAKRMDTLGGAVFDWGIYSCKMGWNRMVHFQQIGRIFENQEEMRNLTRQNPRRPQKINRWEWGAIAIGTRTTTRRPIDGKQGPKEGSGNNTATSSDSRAPTLDYFTSCKLQGSDGRNRCQHWKTVRQWKWWNNRIWEFNFEKRTASEWKD